MKFYITLATCLILAGCGTYSQPPVMYSAERQETDYVFPLKNALQPMTKPERAAIEKKLAAIPDASAKAVNIEVNKRALINSVKVNESRMLLEEAGFDPDSIKTELASGDTPIRLHVHYKAYPYAEHCPDWHPTGLFNQNDNLGGHLGCANLTNLTAMVADPNDLLKGKSRPGADTESAVKAIENHYAGVKPTSSAASGSGETTSTTTSTAE